MGSSFTVCLDGVSSRARLVYVQCSDKLGFAQIIQWRSHVPLAALLTGRWLHDHLLFFFGVAVLVGSCTLHTHASEVQISLFTTRLLLFFGCPKPKVSFPAGNPTDAGPSILVPQRVHTAQPSTAGTGNHSLASCALFIFFGGIEIHMPLAVIFKSARSAGQVCAQVLRTAGSVAQGGCSCRLHAAGKAEREPTHLPMPTWPPCSPPIVRLFPVCGLELVSFKQNYVVPVCASRRPV
jgi:hypothetical protein